MPRNFGFGSPLMGWLLQIRLIWLLDVNISEVENVKCCFCCAYFETPFGGPLLNVYEVGLKFLLDEFVLVMLYPCDNVVYKHAQLGFILFDLADVVEEDVEEYWTEDTALRNSCFYYLSDLEFPITFIETFGLLCSL